MVIVGGAGASHGPAPGSGRSWNPVFLDEEADRFDLHARCLPHQVDCLLGGR